MGRKRVESGVTRAIEILRTEIVRVLKLLGCASTADLDRRYIDVPPHWQRDSLRPDA